MRDGAWRASLHLGPLSVLFQPRIWQWPPHLKSDSPPADVLDRDRTRCARREYEDPERAAGDDLFREPQKGLGELVQVGKERCLEGRYRMDRLA